MAYKIKIELLETNQETFRTLKIPSNITFQKLHEIIQIVLGFTDYHNYQFIIGSDKIITDYYEEDEENNSRTTIIDTYFESYNDIRYEYDFGDEWLILIHEINKLDEKIEIPELLEIKGKYNPVEDCGGPYFFNQLLEARKNKEDLSDYISDPNDFQSINRHNTQNRLRVLFGYEELERPPKKVNPKNTLDKYF